MDNLKPCQFCGEQEKLYTLTDGGIDEPNQLRVWGCPHANGMRVEQWQIRSTPEQVKVPSVEDISNCIHCSTLFKIAAKGTEWFERRKLKDDLATAIHHLLTAEKGTHD